MEFPTPNDSPASTPFAGITTRAAAGPANDTAQPSLTSGFGAVIEKEHELAAATKAHVGKVHGARAADINRMLREQEIRLGANVALLEQRYEMLPNPTRFQALQGRHRPLTRSRRGAMRADKNALPNLVAQHISLLVDIDALILRGSDGQRGELILGEVGRNHQEMAAMLSAFLQEELAVRDECLPPAIAAQPAPRPAVVPETNWENEGGALRPSPPGTPGSANPRLA